MNPYYKLVFAMLLPVAASVVLYLLDKKTAFGKINKNVKQVVFGIVFGLIAVFGTEFGVPINNAQLNCRDAAVLTAGLMFGAPAGIIAGVIGAVERWIAVAWGIGTFTRIACSVSTLIAGFYSAFLRKFMFENKKSGTFISLAIGVVMEVFHLTMIFITNMAEPTKAMNVVGACSIPLIAANGLSVMAAAFVLTLLSRESSIKKSSQTRISQTIQRWLLVTVVLAFAVTSYFVFNLQNQLAKSQYDSLLSLALDETAADITDASDANLLSITRKVSKEIETESLESVAEKYNLAEISVINKKGIIEKSTFDGFIGFDMSSGEQAKEFLCLLDHTKEFVQDYGPITYDPSIMRKYAGVKTENGFVQVGYDAEQFQSDIAAQVEGITKNRHVGQSGYILIVDEKYNLISAPEGILKRNISSAAQGLNTAEENATLSAVVNNEKAFCRYIIDEGYYIISVLPEKEAFQLRNIALYVNSFMEILVFAILFGLIYFLIKQVVVNQIKSINKSLAKITGGDLDEVVNVRSNEEFASLSDDINSTVDTLKRYISEASARIDAELEFAKNIQASALPNIFPAFPKRKDFDIYASMNPAKEVGGDFYDFYLTDNDTLNMLIADVSGKGIPAAMFMMRAKTELKSLTEAGQPVCDVFTNGNRALCEGNDAGMFVTAWQGGADLTTGIVRFANAGHNPPLVKRGDGKFEYLKSRAGFVLAGMDGVQYKTQELQLTPGDIIYLYTDGVTEATDADNQLYGEERLLQAINSKEFEDMKSLCEFIKADVDSFADGAPQFDDITMIAFRYIGTEPAPSIHFDNACINDIAAVTEFVESELEKIECPMKAVMQISVAIDEIYSNIVKYGYKDTHGPVTVKFIYKEENRAVYIQFTDEGIPYNPLVKEDPDVTLSAEERSIGGLGIYVVKKTMDDMKYKYENEQNILTIKKFI